ncbi:MAG: HU family DNA-binding protein [Kiritimatiellia bacterium]|jgi:DNA-binding protein HU-beta
MAKKPAAKPAAKKACTKACTKACAKAPAAKAPAKKVAIPTTKAQIVDALANAPDPAITKKQAAAVYDKLLDIAYEGAKKLEKGIMLPGLGKLVKVKRAKRMGTKPGTSERIVIPAKTVVKFRLAKAAKDAVVPPKK